MSTLTASEINDALDVAECAIHDKVADPNEREWLHGILRKLRAGALKSVASEKPTPIPAGYVLVPKDRLTVGDVYRFGLDESLLSEMSIGGIK
jgi:hypothetical protein